MISQQQKVEKEPQKWHNIDARGGTVMKIVNIGINIPEEMVRYVTSKEPGDDFRRNAMMLYPYIQDMTISHGRAAEILGVCKTDLIEYYDSIGIPYLTQTKAELLADLATYERIMGKKQ